MKQLLRIFGIIVWLPVIILFCGEKRTPTLITRPVSSAMQKHILLLYSAEIKKNYVDTVNAHLNKAFGLTIIPEEIKVLPAQLRSAIHKDRYRADSVLAYMRRTYPGKALKIIMLTHHDISTTKYSDFEAKKIKQPESRYKDWAIFGLGSCPGYCCVVSVKRLWARKANERRFLQRVKNISVHEVGHTFGLPHCPEPKCVMNDANETILTVDRSTGIFCEKCKHQLGFEPGA